MFRLVVSSASSSCLSSFIVAPPSIPSCKPEAATAPSMAPRPQRRGLLCTAFVLLLALLGATTSHSKIIDFISQRLGKGDNTCEVHRCPVGETPQHKPHSRPSFNGCGTHELKVNLASNDFTSCCNLHDLAYGSCGRSKHEGDSMFLECMVSQCAASHPQPESKAHKTCMREAKLYWSAVVGLGCFWFKRAQRQHCECRPAGTPATYFDAHEHDLQASLAAMWERAAPLNRTGAYKPKWEEFL